MEDAGAPEAKRPKLDAERPVVRPSLLSEGSRAELKASYSKAQPYPHVVLRDVCDPDCLRAVREEIINNVEATYKETDLFKMFQTGDLANMDKLDPESKSKLPNLLALRDALYSKDFRAFVSEVTGCGDLSEKTDCACNVHAQGGHLLCHDDVIGDRRVSFIIYLTDPDLGWTTEDGGALELYPNSPDEKHVPDVLPTTTHLPLWNCMGIFMVQPGFSFHSIQEVFTADKPRMSIQGWFHSTSPPENAALATATQLQLKPGEDVVHSFLPFLGGEPGGELSEGDKEALLQWVNPAYLDPKSWTHIQAKFREDGSIQLHGFLKRDKAEAVLKAALAADDVEELGRRRRPAYAAGIGGGWRAVGPAHKQRYLRYEGGKVAADGSGDKGQAGALMAQIRDQLFSTGAFARLVKKLTDIGLLGHQAEVRRFRPGLDYTVAHYGLLTKDPQLDAVLCFVDDRGEEDKTNWGDGEVGGFEAYLLADESSTVEAAEAYRSVDDDETGVLNVSAAFNSLNLVLRDEGLMKFVKYLSAQAPSSRWDISMTFQPEDDEDEEQPSKGAAKA
ncbi:hypothetical protein N2152v2_008904 [Parachlorella kessleri]